MRARVTALVGLLVMATLITAPARAAPCVAPAIVQAHPAGARSVPAALVEELAAAVPALMAEAAARTGATSCAPVTITLLPAIEGAAALEPPWDLPSWAVGAAVPGQRRVVVAVTASGRRTDRERVLLHELAHIATRDAGGPGVPRWLDEGLARVIAGEHGADDLYVLARGRVADNLLPLSALEQTFPTRADLAALAYAQAGRAVSLLEAADALPRLLAALREGRSLDDALFFTVGRRLWQLELDVERSIPLWRAWAVLGSQTELALAAAALVCAWGGVRARRRVRQRIIAMTEPEGPSQNAMDLQSRSDRLGVGPSSGSAGAGGGLQRPPRESQGASQFAMHLERPLIIVRWTVSADGAS